MHDAPSATPGSTASANPPKPRMSAMAHFRTLLSSAVLACAFFAFAPHASALPAANQILPAPRAVSWSGDSIVLTGGFTPRLTGCRGTLAEKAVARFERDAAALAGSTRPEG